MIGKFLFILAATIAWLSLGRGLAHADEDRPGFETAYRHKHFFLVWNDEKEPPKIVLMSKRYGSYPDNLSYQVIDAESKVLAEGELPPNSRREVLTLDVSPKYLIVANPGYNGMTIEPERPYGIIGDRRHPLGLNHPQGRLFLYVPQSCERFTIVVRAGSPREGGWVKVVRPDGKVAGEAEGELDEETPIRIAVPEDCRGAAWEIEFASPKSPNVGLDDLNLFVEGDLAPLFVPEKEWAEQYARSVKSGGK